MSGGPTRGLLIRQPWLDHILANRKRWEIRSRPCRQSGPIALIESGRSHIRGIANLVATHGPLTASDWDQAQAMGRIVGPERDALGYAQAFGWELADVKELVHPVPYVHPRGAIIWVRLTEDVQRAIRLQDHVLKASPTLS